MVHVALSKYFQKNGNESFALFELLAIGVSQWESSAGKLKQPVGGGVAKGTYFGLQSEMKKPAVAGIEPLTFWMRGSRLSAHAIRTPGKVGYHFRSLSDESFRVNNRTFPLNLGKVWQIVSRIRGSKTTERQHIRNQTHFLSLLTR